MAGLGRASLGSAWHGTRQGKVHGRVGHGMAGLGAAGYMELKIIY